MIREYFYDIDEQGRLFHDNTRLIDPQFLDFFFQRLKANDTGKYPDYGYISPCGQEMNYIRVADVPIVYHDLNEKNELIYAANLTVPFQPKDLRFSEKSGILYYPSPLGGFGRLSSSLLLQISPSIEYWGPYYSFKDGLKHHVIKPLEEAVHLKVLQPRERNYCFGCGGANPTGLALTFLYNTEEKTAKSWLIAEERMQGASGWMHGGIISLLLDEVMSKVLSGMEISAPTARLEVKFRHPVKIGYTLEICGKLQKIEGRKYLLRGEVWHHLENADNILLAEGEGLFIRINKNSI